MIYDDKSDLTKQDLECLELFRLYDAGAFDLILKTNIKKWEYLLYGGRKEFYPEDRKAIYTLLQFKNKRVSNEQKKAETEARIKQRMKGGGTLI